MMIIRRATRDDIDCIACLWLEMVMELAPEYTPNTDWWIKMVNGLMDSGIYNLFVGENADREIVGFIDYFIWPEPATGKYHAVGQHFYTLKGYRKTPISGQLYRNAIKMAKEQGASVIELFCFPTEKSMWERKGYKPVRSLVRRELCLTR